MKKGQLLWNVMLVALAMGMLATSAARAASDQGDAEAGRVKSLGCMGCHAIPGYSNIYPTYHVPRVGGQHAQYIIEALKAYKSKQRSHPTMQAQAATLSEDDMKDIAAFFSLPRPE